MSFQAMAWASQQKLPAPKKCLLYTLANYAGADGKLWPSYQTLADDAGLSRRSVINYMAEFEAAGIIRKSGRLKSSGDSDTNIWEICALADKRGGAGDSLPPKDNAGGGESHSPQVVQEIHQGSERAAPKPVIEPINGTKDTPPSPPRGETGKGKRGNDPPKKTAFDPLKDVPEGINLTAWAEWVEYRASKRQKISAKAAAKQWARLIRWSPAEQAEMINRSIENDYQGLFDDFLERRHDQQSKQHQNGGASPQRLSTVEAASRAAEAYRERLRREAGGAGCNGYSLAANG